MTTPYLDYFRFEIDPFRKEALLNGLDEIGVTLAMDDAIVAYEAKMYAENPWAKGVARQADFPVL